MKTLSAVEQFQAFARSIETVDVVLPSTNIKKQKSAFFVFALITLTYILFEFVYNRSLLTIASGSPSKSVMDVIEWTGRTMAGVGCAIAVWRFRMESRGTNEDGFSWRGFAFCVILSIPSMWVVQELVIRVVVENAAPSTLKSAEISMMGRQSLLGPSAGQGDAATTKEESSEQDSARQRCKQNLAWTQSPKLEANSQTLWSLLAVMSLHDREAQASLKDLSQAAAVCVIEQTPLRTQRNYTSYARESQRFAGWKTQYEEASTKIAEYEKSRWASKSRTESMWRHQVDKVFGFPTTIPWGLGSEAFDKHPDVARLVGKESGMGVRLALGLDLEAFRKSVSMGVSDALGAPASAYEEHGERRKQGQEAYKTALVPLIGLSLSLFFGLYNATMLGLATCAHLAKRSMRQWASLAMAVSIACLPMVGSAPLTQVAPYRSMLHSSWNAQPLLGAFIAWTVPAQAWFE